MLFFGVFSRESARTAAKSRTNMSTISGKAIKRLGRLAPNLAHMTVQIHQTTVGTRLVHVWYTFGTRLRIRLGMAIG